jgi:hypothetical protein
MNLTEPDNEYLKRIEHIKILQELVDLPAGDVTLSLSCAG